MSEAALERWFAGRCKKLGVYCRKTVSPGHRGFPDRLIAYRGKLALVELKNPAGTGRLSMHQRLEHKRLADHKVSIYVAHTREELNDILAWLTRQDDVLTKPKEK
jgi:hypothetical protein